MDRQNNPFQRALDVLERLHDPDLLDAYKQYVARLETVLGPGGLETYASMYQRDRRQFSGQDAGSLVLPEEIAVHDRTMADPELDKLYQRFIAQLERTKLLDERYVD